MEKIYIMICGCLLLGLTACMKDKGVYESSKALNEITISGIDSLYLVDAGKRIVIRPEISFALDNQGDTANYSYKWVSAHLIGYSNTPRVVAETKDLDTVINNLDFGSHFMYYRVTDKRTGLFQDQYFTLTMGSPDYEGWLTFCDTEDGNSRLDIISRRGTIDTLYRDILSVVGSVFKTDGKPGFMATNINFLGIAAGELAVIIGTDKKAAILGRNSLEYKPDNDLDRFYKGDHPMVDYSNAHFSGKLLAGTLYMQQKLYQIGANTITGPINTLNGGSEFFTPSPYVAQNPLVQGAAAVVFDEDTKTFLRYAGGVTCLSMPKDSLFHFNINMDLQWMDFVPYNGGEVFAVVKDASTNKVYLARFTLAGVQRSFTEIAVPGIAAAEKFAVHPDLGYLLYNIGSKVYEYDFVLKKNIEMLDYGSRPITILEFHPFGYTVVSSTANKPFYQELSRKLVICTWDGQDAKTSGSLDLYTIPDINGPFLQYKSYSGTGKVAFIGYRER